MEFQKILKAYDIEQIQDASHQYYGSEGTIYICQYRSQNGLQQCILKVIKYVEQQEVEKELEVYNKFLKNLNENPNLVYTLKVIHLRDLKSICILMKKYKMNLSDYIKNPLSFNSILIFFHQFLNGYKSLYESKIVHRDIKPENILVSFDNKEPDYPIYKIADFGLSKICQLNQNNQSKVGTPSYAAPEQNKLIKDYQNNKMVDYEKLSKADVFSLGLILYRLYSNKLPFNLKEKEIKDFLKQTNYQKISNLESSKKIEYKEQSFVNLIMFMIQTDPDERVGFKELYQCFDRQLDKFISNCMKLSEQYLMVQLQKNKVQQRQFQVTGPIFNQRIVKIDKNKSPSPLQRQQYSPLQRQQQQYQDMQNTINQRNPFNQQQTIQLNSNNNQVIYQPILQQQQFHPIRKQNDAYNQWQSPITSPNRRQNTSLSPNQQKQYVFQNQQYQPPQTDRGNYQNFQQN